MIRWLSLGVAFLLELAVLLAVGYWGFTGPGDSPVRFVAGLGGPLLMAVLWGSFASPRAPFPLSGAPDVAFRIAWFGVGVLAFWFSGHPFAALTLAVVYAVNAVMLRT